MRYIPELVGHVPLRNKNLETSIEGIYIAGDVAGIEEASSAMVEGRLAGLTAAKSLGFTRDDYEASYKSYNEQLASLRAGPVGEKIISGLKKAMESEVEVC